MNVPMQQSDATVPTDELATESAQRPPRGLPFWANPRLGLLAVIVVLVLVFSSLRSSICSLAHSRSQSRSRSSMRSSDSGSWIAAFSVWPSLIVNTCFSI